MTRAAGLAQMFSLLRGYPEQIIRKLREADRLLAEGQRVAEVAKALEVSEWTLSRWRSQYGGMKDSAAAETDVFVVGPRPGVHCRSRPRPRVVLRSGRRVVDGRHLPVGESKNASVSGVEDIDAVGSRGDAIRGVNLCVVRRTGIR